MTQTKWKLEQKKGLGSVISGERGEHVATVYEANKAALIAAAPELLEALKFAKEELEIEGAQYAADLISLVIEKATGVNND